MRIGTASPGFVVFLFLLLSAGGCLNRAKTMKEPRVILFFGDSITYGSGVDRSTESFYSLIATDLATGTYGPVSAINAGKSGDDTSEAFRRIVAANQARPDIVVIALGLNDCQTKDITPAIYGENIKKIIAALAPGTRVVIATSNTFLETGEPIWTRLNIAFAPFMDVARTVAREGGYDLIDVNAAWVKTLKANPAGSGALYSDPTHPSASGHRLIHDVYIRELAAILKKK